MQQKGMDIEENFSGVKHSHHDKYSVFSLLGAGGLQPVKYLPNQQMKVILLALMEVKCNWRHVIVCHCLQRHHACQRVFDMSFF